MKSKKIKARFPHTTWWGEKWFEALTSRTSPSTIEAGISCVENSGIKDIIIHKRSVEIHLTSYRIINYKTASLIFDEYNPEYKKHLTTIFADDIGATSQLLSCQLEPKLMLLGAKGENDIFPVRENMRHACNCGENNGQDGLCHHIIAALLLIRKEIDTNPFLLFFIEGVGPTENTTPSAYQNSASH